jgi:hypothetical protein
MNGKDEELRDEDIPYEGEELEIKAGEEDENLYCGEEEFDDLM